MAKTDIIWQLKTHFRQENIRNVVILTDENVERFYSGYFSDLAEWVSLDKIVLPAGESVKSIYSAIQIWHYFAEKQYDRDIFLLNFGGGSICDLGGFVASTYKRGIRFANCPTTLLAMIDAAIGGKTGVNLQYLKNGIGTFYFPDIQLPADISFLKTLPEEELRSGFGEMVKYALIGSAELFDNLCRMETLSEIQSEYVDFCIRFKQEVVQKDPRDEHFRHILNFGHTVGHALEGYAAETGKPVAHGIAVAQGIYYESLLSTRLGRLSREEWQLIAAFLPKHYQIPKITSAILEKLLPYMRNDKKNHDGHLNFTLLDRIGHAVPDCEVSSTDLYDMLA
ncbi:MAG: 3-dehydroquinate synthase [Bacteroidales bacterium]|nr:3-dehydroquinate synthase [Bacteroidales bacterium]